MQVDLAEFGDDEVEQVGPLKPGDLLRQLEAVEKDVTHVAEQSTASVE
ncbi:MAG TPA: hypothetical protein VNJ05_09965 [Sphingomicrobium sp.]|nr:hypothetical protein [Sphingomicrobium sp.]